MLKAINHWSFPSTMPLRDVFAHTRKAGYDAIELTLNNPDRVGFTLDSSEMEIREVGEIAQSHGIQLRSLSCGLMWDHSLSSPNPQVREKGRDIVKKQLEIASILGMDTVLVVPAYCTEEVTYDQCYDRSQEELAKLLPYAEQVKITIGIENVWNKFLLSPLEMIRYMDEIGSAFIKVYFDIGNVMLFGHPEQWIRMLGKHICKIHAKDFIRAVGNSKGFVPLLAGDVPWRAVMQALKDIGYDDVITAEITAYCESALQAVYDTSRHLDAIIRGESF
ncbi:sugar phosphate isomerase/epimerase family protein [Paenibacillus cymbidii]|uniref:sugar phosphate isomerase/epimerase family protein n=1 Tax=Paenibacillus cymbidii TaxID=1639034 RepID=UPI001081EB32|nr:sugar phosphate isomerase/epimerase family protein [Paenibacillus cymbidii]